MRQADAREGPRPEAELDGDEDGRGAGGADDGVEVAVEEPGFVEVGGVWRVGG